METELGLARLGEKKQFWCSDVSTSMN